MAHYEDLRNEDAVKTWFYRIVLHESYAILNVKKRFLPADDTYYSEIPYEEKRYEIHDDLYSQISRMEPETQNIIKLRFFEELELREISQILDMNLNTVKTKLYRGLKALKIAIREEDCT